MTHDSWIISQVSHWGVDRKEYIFNILEGGIKKKTSASLNLPYLSSSISNAEGCRRLWEVKIRTPRVVHRFEKKFQYTVFLINVSESRTDERREGKGFFPK